MSGTLNTSGNYLMEDIRSQVNKNGSVTYTGTLKGLPTTWQPATTVYSGTAEVTISVTLPAGTPTPGPGSVFRFNDNGGYNLHLTGADYV